jgi:DNA-binding Lrp family transcriptional regulator
MPFARIADTAGLSVAAVRQRALKLLTAGIVQIKTIVNPAMVGLRGLGVVDVTVRGDASAITRKITELDGLHYVDQTLGTYAVLAQFHCPSLSDLTHRRQQIDQIEGVRSTELFQLHESPSYDGSWA